MHECLDIKFICDGVKDCQDGSDETHGNCLISKCPKVTFRCAYGGCLAQEKACDHQVHCWDSSDELAAICSGNGTSNWSIYGEPLSHTDRTTPMKTQVDSVRSSQESGCMVPRNLKHLQVKTLFNVLPYHLGFPIAESTVVRLLYLDYTELYGSDLNHCLNGQWQVPWPNCTESCRRISSRDTSIRVNCQYNGRIRDCNYRDVKLLPGTMAFIECAPSYLPEGGVQPQMERICTEDPDGKNRPYWSLAAGSTRIRCVSDCGRILPTVKQDPWIVRLFTSDITMRNFSFNCLGYIISPWAVLVEKKCIYTGDVLQYAIAEGQHNVEYTRTNVHTYQLHSVESIFKSKKHAVLKLIDPFILSSSVRPICLPPIPDWYALTNSNLTAVVRRNGQDISYLINIKEDILRNMELNQLNQLSNKMS